jgi:hypothetical protein
MIVDGAKQTLRLRASRYAFDLRVRPLEPTGGGVVNLCGTIAADRWDWFIGKISELNWKAHLCELHHAPVGFFLCANVEEQVPQ